MAFKGIGGLSDARISGPGGSVTLSWSTGAARRINRALQSRQELIDSETLRLCSPYVPFKTGALERSGQIGTVIGTGEVVYATPYARRQYYATAQTRSYDPRRGGMWLERMKTANKGALIKLLNQW